MRGSEERLRCGARVGFSGISAAIVAVGLLASPALRAIDDLEQHRPLGRPHRKDLAFDAYKSCRLSTLAANDISSAHKQPPPKAIRNSNF